MYNEEVVMGCTEKIWLPVLTVTYNRHVSGRTRESQKAPAPGTTKCPPLEAEMFILPQRNESSSNK